MSREDLIPVRDVLPPFDYSSLPAGLAADLRSCAERIKARTNLALYENGRDLLAIRDRPEMRGRFVEWLGTEFQLSEATAYNMMQVAQNLSAEFVRVTKLGPAALYALAAPRTPASVREEVERRVGEGEKISAAEIERLKREAKEEAQREVEHDLARARDEAAKLRKEVETARTAAGKKALDAKEAEVIDLERRAKAAKEKIEEAKKEVEHRRWAAEKYQKMEEQHRAYMSGVKGSEVEQPQQIKSFEDLIRVVSLTMVDINTFEHAPEERARKLAAQAADMCRQMAEALDAFVAPSAEVVVLAG